MPKKESSTKDHIGHRKRLKEKLYNCPKGSSLPDYELLELFLFRTIPRKNTKPIAKELLRKFGSLEQIFGANYHALMEIDGCGENVVLDFLLLKEIMARCTFLKLREREIIDSAEAAELHFKTLLATEEKEYFYALFLDNQHKVIKQELIQEGTINEVAMYPREVLRAGLYCKAAAVILVHNHPSWVDYPSESDIEVTKRLIITCHNANISVLEHFIIAGNKVVHIIGDGYVDKEGLLINYSRMFPPLIDIAEPTIPKGRSKKKNR